MIAIAKTGGTPVEILIAEDIPTQALQLQHILEEQGSRPSTQHLTARTSVQLESFSFLTGLFAEAVQFAAKYHNV